MDIAYRLALVGNPNCGKTALFNALTGSRQKVANYPGVTVERRSGRFTTDDGVVVDVVDLPGSYSLRGRSPDEEITRDVVLGRFEDELQPDVILCVLDATNLRGHLRLALELKRYGLPMIVALNMMDLARHREMEIDLEVLSRELGVPVVPTVAVRKSGLTELVKHLSHNVSPMTPQSDDVLPNWQPLSTQEFRDLQKQAKAIADKAIVHEGTVHRITRQIDDIVLNPLFGIPVLALILFLVFQAVFSWAETPMEWIDTSVVWLQGVIDARLPEGGLKSLLVDGILAGVGSVIIFLPQIVILFTFILLLEASGYMARAAFLMDKLMARVGLNGRAFIPLLSSFACAIPGIMAARTIDNQRDRLTTILIAPLMTCSARLPVYTLVIAAFIPNTATWGGFGLQGVVMFGLYFAGIISALIIAAILKLTVTKGAPQPLILELPSYKVPVMRDLLVGIWERVKIFLRRAGTIILIATIALWVLAGFPSAPTGATQPDIYYSVVGLIGRGLAVILEPIGFGWEIAVALVPGMAAREVAVAALGTVYALSGSEDMVAERLVDILRNAWTLPTALAFLAWYVFAPQCISTLATARRETNSWAWTAFMFGYLMVLAYAAAFVTYRVALALS